jgi:hypothetical protein
MCLKHLGKRRPLTDGGVEELDIAAHATTVDAVHLREDLRQVVGDVQELPETQRTALLLREIDGLSYEQIAGAMDTSVPGVKSLLVRARVSLAESAEGRLMSCEVVHLELRQAAEGLAKLSGPARRHARQCELCGGYQGELGIGGRRAAAAAAFLPFAPLAFIKSLASKFGAGAAGGTSAGLAGGSSGAAVAGAVGTKAAVAVATATLVAAGAADIHKAATHHRHHASAPAQAAIHTPSAVTARPVAISPSSVRPAQVVSSSSARSSATVKHRHHHHAASSTGTATVTTPSSPTTDALPATTGGGTGTFTDTPPPASTTPTPTGHDTPATDPATQPMGGTEPVQVQGFTPGGDAGDGSANSP